MSDVVGFTVSREGAEPPQICISINGAELAELVRSFEDERGYRPAGGYAGLIPAHFNFGDLVAYFLGEDNGQWPRPGVVWLLGCDCGEVGCWPFEATISATSEHVTWARFRQPFRTTRDYSSLGPFEFGRAQYEAALKNAMDELQGLP